MSDEKIWDPTKLRGSQFTGAIADAQWEIRNFDWGENEYLVLTLSTDFTPNPISIRIKYSDHKNSIWRVFLDALSNTGISIKSEKDLIGLKFKWERKDLRFGPNIVVTDFPVPIECLGKVEEAPKVE